MNRIFLYFSIKSCIGTHGEVGWPYKRAVAFPGYIYLYLFSKIISNLRELGK